MKTFTGYSKGINLGGWFSQCGEGNYNEEHYSTFITNADIDSVAAWGFDHVRLPIDYNVIQNEDGSFIESGFAHIDSCVRRCHENKLNIIIDLHKTAGFVFDDASYCSFFTDAKLQEQFVKLWEEIARRYGGHDDFITFELLNEITTEAMIEPWNNISEAAITAIRRIAPKIHIIIGGIYNNSIAGLRFLNKPHDENIVFTFHCYSPMIFTHQGAYWIDGMPLDYRTAYPSKIPFYRSESLRIYGSCYDDEYEGLGDVLAGDSFFDKLFSQAAEVSKKYNVPLYCGEYGVIDRADNGSTLNWYADIQKAFAKYNIPHAAWTYQGLDFGVTDKLRTEILQQLITLM